MQTTAQARDEMVRQLRADGITDERVLEAMAEIPREHFLSPELESHAYADTPLDIGRGQTISTPWIVAFSTSALQVSADSTVLEVGTGSGYGAAVLSRCCRSVITIEREPELAARARDALSSLGCSNVEVRDGDGTVAGRDAAPYDGILVAAMATDELPGALIEQLAPAGTLVCPVGHAGVGDLVRYRDGRSESLEDVGFVPLVTGQR
ncbi:MAG: protein-L-isoaspartate(D-aspartate) O-methyltransferase [Pseudonocardiaceae bacterium]|nr:protein-L-isoaspartate(D-aspartate) O-methyltransferase [Pseudonocardiaceae bacterium]